MQTTKSFLVGLLVLCIIYRSDGLLDTENTLLTAIKQLNSTFQKTAAELQSANNVISMMNATIQKTANDLQNEKTAMNTAMQKSEMKISSLEQEVHQLRQGKTPAVIFYAYLNSGAQVGPGQTLPFDKVLTNVGHAYDPRHAHFTAPVDGYYHFSATVGSMTHAYLHISMVKNGALITKIYAGYEDYETGSGSANIELAANDMVWLVHTDSMLHTLNTGHCMFSGFIISANT